MTLPLLPPRGIFIPTQMIFNPQLSPAVLVTWIQLRCLAWGGWITPSLSMQELAILTGKNQAKLYRYMTQLKHLSALSWRTTEMGSIIVSFTEQPPTYPKNATLRMQLNSPSRESSAPPGDSVYTNLNTHKRELPNFPSYFPAQILGYLSIQEDDQLTNVKAVMPTNDCLP